MDANAQNSASAACHGPGTSARPPPNAELTLFCTWDTSLAANNNLIKSMRLKQQKPKRIFFRQRSLPTRQADHILTK